MDRPRLAPSALATIQDGKNEVCVSAVSAWEMAVKFHLGKWPEAGPVIEGWEALLDANQIGALPITAAHAVAAAGLDWPHRDPFDRLLVAQARAERFRLVTADPILLGFLPDALPAR